MCRCSPAAFVGIYSLNFVEPRPQQVIQKRMTIALQVMEPEKASWCAVVLYSLVVWYTVYNDKKYMMLR